MADKPFVGIPTAALSQGFDDVATAQQLVGEYLRIADKGGSDVRLDMRLPYRAGA